MSVLTPTESDSLINGSKRRNLKEVDDMMVEQSHKVNKEVPDHYVIPNWRRYAVEFMSTFLLVCRYAVEVVHA
jgi:hypothetical protein